mmetsp:Transcript_34588/g.55602  ORF Transcript_34588/g.55602 Transcript_34588/m.55602 type:complete len:237 (+) Transcript_34588:521-1231(+)
MTATMQKETMITVSSILNPLVFASEYGLSSRACCSEPGSGALQSEPAGAPSITGSGSVSSASGPPAPSSPLSCINLSCRLARYPRSAAIAIARRMDRMNTIFTSGDSDSLPSKYADKSLILVPTYTSLTDFKMPDNMGRTVLWTLTFFRYLPSNKAISGATFGLAKLTMMMDLNGDLSMIRSKANIQSDMFTALAQHIWQRLGQYQFLVRVPIRKTITLPMTWAPVRNSTDDHPKE